MVRNVICSKLHSACGEIGEEKCIPISRLKVDHDYQRPRMSPAYISKIAKNWNWDLVGRLAVVDRDGEYYVVDGQQRLAAAEQRDDVSELPCIVRKSAGIEYEARTFLGMNTGGKKPSMISSYRAGLIGGNKTIIEIERFLTTNGYSVGDSDTINTIQCVGTMLKIYTRSPARLFEALGNCMKVARHNFQISADFLMGMYTLCANNKELDDVAIQKLRNAGWPKIRREIENQKVANGSDGGRSQALGILKVANYQRPKKNRVDLYT